METSGEIILHKEPQDIETKEIDPKAGLSVNGSQIIALASLEFLQENGFVKPARPNILERLKSLKARPHYEKLTAIKRLILEGKTEEAKRLLQQGLTLGNPVHIAEDVKKEAIAALSKNISVKEAFEEDVSIDAPFRQFIQSLPGKPLDQLPEETTGIFLTQVGARAAIYPKSNELSLQVYRPPMLSQVFLQADQQHPFYIEEKEVFDEPSKENALSKLEVFAELAKRYKKVFTHMTGGTFLPAILSSGHFGNTYPPSEKRLYVETLTFKDLPKYHEVIQSIKSGNDITIPWDEINPAREKKITNGVPLGYNYPLHELTYVRPKEVNPVAIFSDQLPQGYTQKGWVINGNIDIKDKCLIGIWTTPQYKQHLLHWISTWDDEKRQQVFGERKPEDVLISSAKDLPPL